jgi:hypothetical protein
MKEIIERRTIRETEEPRKEAEDQKKV